MISLMVAMVLAQGSLSGAGTSLSKTDPIQLYDEGSKAGRTYAIDCRGAGISCTRDGGFAYITVSGGGSSPTVSCAADQALGWDGVSWSCVSQIRSAYAADAGITANYLPITCSVGQFITCNGSSCSCATPSGGGGSANFVSSNAVFDGGYDITQTVTAAWATPSSNIICSPYGEQASFEGLTVVPIAFGTGNFVVRAQPRNGRHSGSLPFFCTGN